MYKFANSSSEKFKNRRFSKMLAVLVAFSLFIEGCKPKQDSIETDPTPTGKVNPVDAISSDLASKWAEMTMKMTRTTSGYTPPVASRAYGLAGLTMYESVVNGMPESQSLAGQLSTLPTLPKTEAGKTYNWALAMNAAEATMLRGLYATTAKEAARNKVTIDSLETVLIQAYKSSSTQEETERSQKYGSELATAIFEWAKTDGGHEGYLRNFPASYVVPVFPGSWEPTENGQKIPMQPTWGNNRTFVPANQGMALPEPIKFSSELTSQYFAQYLEVYSLNKALSQDQKDAAVWWADDPAKTFTPPGHSYSIANIAVKTSKVGLGKAAEAFARTGIAVNDAFINCWKCKYKYNNERPYTMVRRNIDPNWKPFWPAPPFPGFVSGHSTQSTATAEVLTNMFGSDFKFVDNSHVGRAKDEARNVEFKARTFDSFYEFAEESGLSRIYGGIHTRQDNEVGQKEGRKIGRNVNALKFKK